VKKECKTLLINLYAGPGTGKSSSMAGIFSHLKWMGVNCEMAPEFAKEKVWEGSLNILSNQIYVFGKQLHTIHRLMGKVDVIITDSPLLFSVIYGEKEGKEFKDLVLKVYKDFWSWNIFLKRSKAYNPSGRLQTEDQAKEIDAKIFKLLLDNQIEFETRETGPDECKSLAEEIIKKINV